MKRIITLTLTLAVTLTLAACTQTDTHGDSVPTPATPTGAAAVTTAETAVTTTEVSRSGEVDTSDDETIVESDEISTATEETTETESLLLPDFDYSPLELLGYYINEEGRIMVDDSDWEECDPDVFREYMFGTWEGNTWNYPGFKSNFFTLDDSEENFYCNLKFAENYYRRGDTIIFISSNYQSEQVIFWIDINKPDILYNEGMNWRFIYTIPSKIYTPFSGPNDEIVYKVNFMTKANMPVNEPQNSYMSRLRLYEIMQEYDIDFETIFVISYELNNVKNPPYHFIMDGHFNTYPIYLISKSLDKFTFKSSLVYPSYSDPFLIDVIYTIEKINGEWERTFEIDQERLEEIYALLLDN